MAGNEIRKFHFIKGDGEMARLTRAFDWASTPVGPVDTWPQTLKAVVGIILHSEFPMFLWWGDDMIQFYNDAYRPSLGNEGKHPKALGQKAVDCWPEIWHIIYPLIKQVKTTDKSFFLEDQLVPIFRNGKIEDVYWTFSYSSVIGETGNTDGVLVVCTETTRKVNILKENERAQEQIKQSEANLSNIIRQAPIAMSILKGPQFIVEMANDRMFKLWGKPAAAFLGKPVFDTLLTSREEGYEALLNHVYQTGETYTVYNSPVTLYQNGKEELVYAHFVYEALREVDGTISGVMMAAVEITEEVLARKKLEQRENQFRTLIESAPFPIAVYVGREMRIDMANQAIIDVWGKGQDVIGKTYYQILPELESQAIYPLLDNVFTTGIPFHARNQRVDLVVDGKLGTFYFNYSFSPLFDDAGKVYGVMNTAAEVTDLVSAKQQVEQSERNFRNMVMEAPVAMCIMLGPDHIVEVANDLMIELWGKEASQVLKRPVFEGLPDARDQGLEELLSHVYATGETFYASERPVILLRKGKSETVYQNFVYEPYRDPDGKIVGVFAITIDVTLQVKARQKIEEVVTERTLDLQKINAELSQFAYVTSHDLQEPARKISMFVEQIGRALGNNIDPKIKSYLGKIDTSAARMLSLIRDILSISQLSKNNYEFQKTNLNEILREVKNDFELLIEEKECNIQSDTLPLIDAIPVQMRQVFSNLISNAIKFSSPGKGISLDIKSSPLSNEEKNLYPNLKPSAAYWKITFTDNGIGFSQANAEKIFEIFQRLHSQAEYQGTGIGLAMCRKIVENHGGYIFATSSLGSGATFTIIMPASQPY